MTTPKLKKYLAILKNDVENHPSPSLIFAARFIMTEFDRNDIPDWVAVLAGGNLDLWEDVLDLTKTEMELEEEDY